ncbi:MAG: ACT domain-containing protein [Bryobacterales bacterium]|nr:ACT domain-containing protein [Bryobacterales bacterium]
MTLTVMDGRYAVCRLAADAPAPDWVPGGGFVSITRTAEELSVVCPQGAVPEGVPQEKDFRILKVEGPLDFSLTGVLAGLSGALAEAKISLFAVSTFDTDYILVRDADLARALEALTAAGHHIR